MTQKENNDTSGKADRLYAELSICNFSVIVPSSVFAFSLLAIVANITNVPYPSMWFVFISTLTANTWLVAMKRPVSLHVASMIAIGGFVSVALCALAGITLGLEYLREYRSTSSPLDPLSGFYIGSVAPLLSTVLMWCTVTTASRLSS